MTNRVTLERIKAGGVMPLEIWNLEHRGRLLVDRIGARGRTTPLDAAELLDVVDAFHAGTLPGVEGFETLYLAGGLIDDPSLRAALAAASRPYRIVLAADGRFAGEPGGVALLAEASSYQHVDLFGGIDSYWNPQPSRVGAVVDVGQTAVKISTVRDDKITERRVVQRPGGLDTPAAVTDWLKAVVPKVPALVIALPCTIDPDCTLGECTYPWQNDPDFLPRTLGHLDGTVRLINDAELAAMSAFLTGAASGRTFVITLGYGPGAALVDRRAGNQRRAT